MPITMSLRGGRVGAVASEEWVSVILRPRETSLSLMTGCLLGQFLLWCVWFVTTLENQVLAERIVGESTWRTAIRFLGGSMRPAVDGLRVDLPLLGPILLAALVTAGFTLAPGWWPTRDRTSPLAAHLGRGAVLGALFSLPMAVGLLLWLSNFGIEHAVLNWSLAFAVRLGGGIWTAVTDSMTFPAVTKRSSLRATPPTGKGQDGSTGLEAVASRTAEECRAWCCLLLAVAGYVLAFTVMNQGLWYSLRLPHGDSAMYEEHLWNLLHGKGFRSYLDQGLFLGEHIQVIHVLLVPFYLVWPSHLCLELCETLALASTAIPVYRVARRHLNSPTAAACLGGAALCYFPLHYLDIAIDLKTFRPNAFGIPILMWGIDFLERRRWKSLWGCLALALACQEDYAIVIAPLGLWMAFDAVRRRGDSAAGVADRKQLGCGIAICLGAAVYLAFAVKVAIPWFRDGETVHYARYFAEFGEGPFEIALNMLLKPGLLFSKLAAPFSVALGLQLLVPMPGFRGWSRLSIAAPLFVLLCLNEIQQSTPGHLRPVHHFHAPLIPFVFWAACIPPWRIRGVSEATESVDEGRARAWGRLVLCLSFSTCVFFSMSPAGIAFWDGGSPFHWRKLYVPDARGEQFAKIPPLIPLSARVASTDFVHPRFTHHERSYDYSDYPRKVSDYLPKVPDDTDFIVLDFGHPYSRIRRIEDVRELKESPRGWEIVPVDTQGLFLVLKRSDSASPDESVEAP